MNRIVTILLIGVITFCSCKNDNLPKKPENLISEDKMVNILIDLSILSSAKGLNKKIIENNGITPDAYVYQKHDIDSTQFSESNAYYSHFIDEYSNIYIRVKDSLEKLKIKYEMENEVEYNQNNNSKIKKKSRMVADTLKNQNDDINRKPLVLDGN